MFDQRDADAATRDFDGWLAFQPEEQKQSIQRVLDFTEESRRAAQKQRIAGVMMISAGSGADPAVVDANWDVARYGFAADNGWNDARENDAAFFGRLRERAEFNLHEREIVFGEPVEERRRKFADSDRTGFDLRMLQYPGYMGPQDEKKYLEEVWTDSLANKVQEALLSKKSYLDGLAAWQKKKAGHPGYAKEHEDYYARVAREFSKPLGEMLAKVRPVAERAYGLMAASRWQTGEEGDSAPTALFRGLAPKEKEWAFVVMERQAQEDERLGIIAAKHWRQALTEGMGRSFENLYAGASEAQMRTRLLMIHFRPGDEVGADTPQREITRKLAIHHAATHVRGMQDYAGAGLAAAMIANQGTKRRLTAEEAAKWNEEVAQQIEDLDTAGELRRFGQQVIDPANKGQNWFMRKMVLPAADSTALLAHLAVPGASWNAIPVFVESYQNDEYAQLRRQGMERREANLLAGVTGMAQALLDKVQVGILGKALPGTKRALEGFVLRNGAARRLAANAAMTTGAETVIELAQDHIVPALVQDNLASDPKFDVRWSDVWMEAVKAAPDTALGMVLISAGGATAQTWGETKFVQELAANPAAMRVRGYSLEQIREIQAAPAAARGALLAKHLPERAPLGEEQERLLAELKPLLKEGQLLLREQVGQEQTAEAEARDYGIRLELKTGGGWMVQLPDGQSVAVSSAEAARRIREDLKQTKTQAEAEQYVRLVESWAQTAPEGVTRQVGITGDTVTTDGQTVTRTGRSGESQVEEVSAQALEELRRQGRIVAEAAGNEALELAINGSNFVGRVAEGAKELVQRLEINRSLHGPALTFLHERVEADLKAGIKTGAITWEETRQAVGSLAEAFKPERARSKEERALSERVQKVTRGEASETELRETLVELAVGDIIGRRRDGSVVPAGSVTAALDAAVRSTADVSQVKALGKFRTFLRAVRTYFRGVFRTVAAINKAKREGYGQEFSALMNKLLGTDGQMDFRGAERAGELTAAESYALRKGASLNSQKKQIPKTPDKMPAFDDRGAFEDIRTRVVEWMKQNLTSRTPDGKVILIANPENGSLETRAEHWMGSYAKDDPWRRDGRDVRLEKVRSIGAIATTISGAQAEARAATGKTIYLRRYADGALHAVFVDKENRVTEHGMINGAVATQFTLDPRRGIEGAMIVQDWTETAPASSVNPVKGAEADRVSTPGRQPVDQQGDTSTPPAHKYLTADGDIVNLPPGQKSDSEGTSYSLSPNSPGTRPIHEFLNMERAPFRTRLELVNDAVATVHAVPEELPTYEVVVNGIDESDGLFGGREKRIYVLSNARWPELTYSTEIGHLFDLEILGRGRKEATAERIWLDIEPITPTEELMIRWTQAVENTAAIKELRRALPAFADDLEVTEYLNYLLKPSEIFARSYTQAIAMKASGRGAEVLKQQIVEKREEERNRFWQPDDFSPLLQIFEEVFKGYWLKQ